MISSRWRLPSGLVALMLLSACTTVVSGTDQRLLVETEPAGATCTLTRNGANLGAVNAAPASVSISKSRHDIMVTCEKADYQTRSELVSSSLDPLILGNVLFGVVGLTADLASGAWVGYPEAVKVVLRPTSFRNAAARDAFFEARVAAVVRDFDNRIESLRSACINSGNRDCMEREQELRKERERELLNLAEQRRSSVIRS